MASQPDLTRQRDIGSNLGAPRNPDLGTDDCMGTDLNVMGDLNKVIDLAPLADHCPAEPGAVNCCVRADLDIAPDLDDPGLGNLHVSTILKLVTEATGSYDRTRLEDHAVSKRASLTDDGSRVKAAVFAHANLPSDQAGGSYHTSIADFCTRLDDRQSTNRNAGPEHGGWVNHGSGMNSRGSRRLHGGKSGNSRCKSGGGILHTEQNRSNRLVEGRRNNDGSGLASAKLGEISRVSKKGDISFPSLLQGSDTTDFGISSTRR